VPSVVLLQAASEKTASNFNLFDDVIETGRVLVGPVLVV